MLKKLKNNYFLLISTFLVLYFFFNLMSGERGLISYFEKKEILQNLKDKEIRLSSQIEELDLKKALEILIRERFLFGKKEEKIYIIKNNDTKN